MAVFPPIEKLAQAVNDAELIHQSKSLKATIRYASDDESIDFVFGGNSSVPQVRRGEGEADVTITGSNDFWKKAFEVKNSKPLHGEHSTFTMAGTKGLKTEGDFLGIIAPYSLTLQCLYFIFLRTATPLQRRPFQDTFRDTDTAVGRYVWVKANEEEARIYYEEAGTGKIPLLCQATAGSDSRQYRYLLADPDLQKTFRIIAYDLPYHGRSLPPVGVSWWTQEYKPTVDYLMNWVVGIADALKLEQPFFMGCSVGGQLALDLAAERKDRFGAFISLNGWYDCTPALKNWNNDLFRTPSVSSHLFSANMIGGCSPIAPEANVHEVQWVYASNYFGIYAGDNDYFAHGHDLKINGHKIDGVKPVLMLAGEYDATAHDEEHGGPAIARNIPTVDFQILDGLSHFAMSDDPIGFREALIPILNKLAKQVETQ